jgi:uncharacterized protein YnzC (UPF0291/DUF896 family)
MAQVTNLQQLNKEFWWRLKFYDLYPPTEELTMSKVAVQALARSLTIANDDFVPLHESLIQKSEDPLKHEVISYNAGVPGILVATCIFAGALRSLARQGVEQVQQEDINDAIDKCGRLVSAFRECELSDQKLKEGEDKKQQEIRKDTFDSIKKIMKNRLTDVLLDPKVDEEPNLEPKLPLEQKLLEETPKGPKPPSWFSKLFSSLPTRSGAEKTDIGSGQATRNTSGRAPTLTVAIPDISGYWPNFTNFGDQSDTVLSAASFTNHGPDLSRQPSQESVHSATQ